MRNIYSISKYKNFIEYWFGAGRLNLTNACQGVKEQHLDIPESSSGDHWFLSDEELFEKDD